MNNVITETQYKDNENILYAPFFLHKNIIKNSVARTTLLKKFVSLYPNCVLCALAKNECLSDN